MLTNIPNLLTLSRIVIIPILIVLFYVGGDFWRWVSCALFTLAGVTDYFDGYLARRWAQISPFGRFLDPIADKLLVAAVILMLVAKDWISGWMVLPALVILCREVLVSGLREFLAQVNVGVPVSKLAKWKTALQLVALGILIVGDAAGTWVTTAGEACLWAAAALTIVTGYDYLSAGLKHMTGPG
jgi:cardiolipin synthase (CMP-forming)